jgi:hypothetical protein
MGLMAIGFAVPAFGQSPRYGVKDSIYVGDVPPGDFYTLDTKSRLLLGAGAKIVDVDSKRVVAFIADTAARGGFVIAPEFGRGIVRNGILFDLKSGAVIEKLPSVGDASLYDPFTGRAFLLGATVYAIDMKTGTIVDSVSVPGAGEQGVSDGRGKVYLTLAAKDSIAVVDSRRLQILARYSVAPGKAPMAIAIDTRDHRLLVGCDGKVVVLNSDDGRVVASITTPGYSEQNAFDPETKLLFEPGGEGNGLVIIHEDSPDRYSVVQTVTDSVALGLRVMVDPQTHYAYVAHRAADRAFSYFVLEPRP